MTGTSKAPLHFISFPLSSVGTRTAPVIPSPHTGLGSRVAPATQGSSSGVTLGFIPSPSLRAVSCICVSAPLRENRLCQDPHSNLLPAGEGTRHKAQGTRHEHPPSSELRRTAPKPEASLECGSHATAFHSPVSFVLPAIPTSFSSRKILLLSGRDNKAQAWLAHSKKD